MTVRHGVAMVLAGAAMTLAACQQEQAPVAASDGNESDAEGEVLPGTISDEMIPYDELGQDLVAPLPPPVPATDTARTTTTPTATRSPAPRSTATRRPATPAATSRATATATATASASPTPDEAEAAEE